MATTTPNLGLKKPNVTDKVNVSDLNGNADLLDAIIGRLSNLNTTQKDSLVAAINEALTSAGTAAGFGNPVATVDGNTGTPSVEVTASGPDTAKVFTFTFKNLKGAKGAKGDPGSAGSDGISPVVSVETISGGHRITITDADGSQSFDVLDGASGSGSGDMTKSVYDPQGKAQDIFAYADTKYSKPSGGIPKKDLASDVQASLGKADSALQNAPVTSVNSKTGAVSLTKGDVGLGNVDNVKQYSASNPPPYPVTSVNGKTGAVTVSVPTIPSTTSLIKGNGSGGVSAAVKGTDYAAPSVGVSVTLRASGWNANAKTQTVSVAGVTATANCIITAAPDSYMTYAKAGVRCTAQGAGTLTFACETVPTADVEANVLIIG